MNFAFYRDCQIRNNRRPYWKYGIYRDCQIRINRRQYLNYAISRDSQNRICRRPYWIYAIYRDSQIRITGGHIGIMLFIEIDKGESNSNISISIDSIKTMWPQENRIFLQSPVLVLLAKLYLINVSCVVLVNPFLSVLFSLFSDFVSVA